MFRFLKFGKINPHAFTREAKAATSVILEHEKHLIEICRQSPEEAMKQYGVTEQGLKEEQVDSSRTEHGSNVLSARKQMGVIRELVERCRNPLVIQLLVICVVSLLMGDTRSAVVVGGMIVLSVGLGYVQEHRSSKAVEKLHDMVCVTLD